MKKSLVIQCALMVLFTLILLWTVPASAADAPPADKAAKTVYVCGCGPACGCNTVADQPGKCPCGKPLVEKQVVQDDAAKPACAHDMKAAGDKPCDKPCAKPCSKPCDKPCSGQQPAEAK